MAYTSETGILNYSKYDNYEKNDFYYFTIKIEVRGETITGSAMSKSSTYPISTGTKISFEIDWSDKRNNKYKGDHYFVKKIKTLEGNSSSEAPNTSSQSSRKSPSANISQSSIDKRLKQAAQSTAIKYVEYVVMNEILPAATPAIIEQYADHFYNNYYSNSKDYVSSIYAMDNALKVMFMKDLMDVAFKIKTKEQLLDLANSFTKYYTPQDDDKMI